MEFFTEENLGLPKGVKLDAITLRVIDEINAKMREVDKKVKELGKIHELLNRMGNSDPAPFVGYFMKWIDAYPEYPVYTLARYVEAHINLFGIPPWLVIKGDGSKVLLYTLLLDALAREDKP